MSRSMPSAATPPRPLSARVGLWLLAWCLLLGPALGRMHQVVHGQGLRATPPISGLQGQGAALATLGSIPQGDLAGIAGHARAAVHGSVLEALFHGHAGNDCELLDQLLFSMALLTAPVLAALPAAAPTPQAPPATGIGARPQRAFLARAPPATARA